MGCGANYKEAEKNKSLLSEARRSASELKGVAERHQHEGHRLKSERDAVRSELIEAQVESRLLQKRLEEAEAKHEKETKRGSRLDSHCSALENESRALRDELLAATAEKMAECKAAEKHRADAGHRDSAFSELRTRASELAVGFENLASERNSLLAEREHAQQELRLARMEAIAAQSEATVGRSEALAAKSEAKALSRAASAAEAAASQAAVVAKASQVVQEACIARAPQSEQPSDRKVENDMPQMPPPRQSRRIPPARRNTTLKPSLNGGAPTDDPGATWNAVQTNEQTRGSTPMHSPTTPRSASMVSPGPPEVSPRNVPPQLVVTDSAQSPRSTSAVRPSGSRSPRSSPVEPVLQDRPPAAATEPSKVEARGDLTGRRPSKNATTVPDGPSAAIAAVAKAGETSRRPSRPRPSQRKSSSVGEGRPKAKAKQKVAAPWDADEPSSSEEPAASSSAPPRRSVQEPAPSSSAPPRRSVEVGGRVATDRGKRSSLPVPPPQGSSSSRSTKVIAPWDEPDSDEGGEEQQVAPDASHTPPAPSKLPQPAPPRLSLARSASPQTRPVQAQADTEELNKGLAAKSTPNRSSLSVPPPLNRGNARESSRDSDTRGSLVPKRIRPSPRRSLNPSEGVVAEVAQRPPPRESPAVQVFKFDFSVFDFLQHEALQSARGIRDHVPGATNGDVTIATGRCGPSASSASTVASSSSPLCDTRPTFPPVPLSSRSQQSATQGRQVQESRSPRRAPPNVADSSGSSLADSVSEVWDPQRAAEVSARAWEENDVPQAARARSGSKRCP